MVTGIDIGLKSTALVTIDDTGTVISQEAFGSANKGTYKSAVSAHPAERYKLYEEGVRSYLGACHTVGATICMEYPCGQILGNGRKVVELYGLYVAVLYDYAPVTKIYLPNPTQIKKLFTTFGAASKLMMITAAKQKGFDPKTDHLADAFACAKIVQEGKLTKLF